jgi:hypothetical protein
MTSYGCPEFRLPPVPGTTRLQWKAPEWIGQGIMMIEFDLGDEPEFDDLDLVSEERYRGRGDDATIEPLKGRVKVGGPRGFEITEARIADDEGLRRFIEEGNRQVAYYYICLGISFVTHDGPRLEAAQVKLTLSARPAVPPPSALAIRPFAEGTAEKIERVIKVAPKLTLPVVGGTEVGDFEAKREYEQTRLFVRGLGLEGSTPSWEFTRVPGKRLEGTCRLEVIFQAGRSAAVTVAGSVTAQATLGQLLWRYRGELPNPLPLVPYTLGGNHG